MSYIQVNVNTASADSRLFSDAVIAGGFIFTTGQMPLGADAELVSDDFVEQAQFAPRGLAETLKECGSSPDNIVRLTFFLSNIDDVNALAPVRREFLGENRPASIIIEVSRFATPGMRVEVEAIALVDA